MAAGSYHLVRHKDGSLGPDVAPCATSPCKLHGGTDFQASSPDEAEKIGQAMTEAMYSKQGIGLSQKENDEAREFYEKRINTQTILDVYKNPVAEVDDDNVQRDLHPEMSAAFTDAMKYSVQHGMNPTIPAGSNFVDTNVPTADVYTGLMNYAHSLSDEDADRIIKASGSSFEAIANNSEGSSKQELAASALMLEADKRSAAHSVDYAVLTDKEKRAQRRNANALLSGKIDLDEIYRKQNPGSKKMPEPIRKRILQNAWANASDRNRKALMKAESPMMKYAPSSELASFARHTRPSNKELAGLSKEERAQKIRDYRFSKLDALYNQDKTKFRAAIYSGAVSPNDSMAFVNKHPVDKNNVNDTVRLVNNYLRAMSPQGNPGKDFETGKARFNQRHKNKDLKDTAAYRASDEYKSIQQYNRREMRKYLTGKTKAILDKNNFKDANGNYDPEAHGRALFELAYGTGASRKVKTIDADGKQTTTTVKDNGYLPAALFALQSSADVTQKDKKIPDKAITYFAAMSQQRFEPDYANSRYQKQYAEKHNGDMMKRWANIKPFLHVMHSGSMSDAKAMNDLHKND